ncbi:MAG: hypothetical protein AAF805_04440, partial [Planctomycetota bacterium]
AEWLMARGFATLGVPGMLAAKVTLGVGLLLLMSIAARRQGVRPIAAWICLLLVAHNLHAFFPMRPQVLSFAAMGALLLVLERAFTHLGKRRADRRNTRRKSDPTSVRWRWLLLAPPLFALWANTHGAFVAGYAIFVAFLVGRAIEAWWRDGRDATPTVGGLAAIAVASGAATLLNPYGGRLHGWLLQSLGEPRPEITEWSSPTPDNPVFWPFVALVTAAVASVTLTDRRRDPVRIVILLLVGWQAASHLRHIALFAILGGFWLPPHLQSLASRLRKHASTNLPTASLTPWTRRGVAAAIAGAIALQAVFLGQRIAELPVYRSRYPVDAVQWMADQRVRGDLLVCFNWAQYAIASLAPDVRVQFDGRFRTCYPQAVIDRHFDFLMGDLGPRNRRADAGPIDGAAVLEVDRPEWVLVDRSYPHAVGVMAEAAGEPQSVWRLVYQDAVAQLWGRADVVDDPASDRNVPTARRFVSDHLSLTAAPWPALPRRRDDPFQDRRAPGEIAKRAINAAGPPAPADG